MSLKSFVTRRSDKSLAHCLQVLKSEMQKVQSSALLLEKQRNPGIGYWSAGGAAGTPNGSVSRVSIAESLEGARRTSSDGPPASDAGTAGGQEEEVNLEVRPRSAYASSASPR